MRGERANRIVLEKIIKYCDSAREICEKHNFDRKAFDEDTEFQFSCGMCIIQIGELAGRLDSDTRDHYSEIPWRSVIGMRNIFAHDYDIVNNDTLWKTITEDLPELKEMVQKILEADC